jgi:hypothetical protein
MPEDEPKKEDLLPYKMEVLKVLSDEIEKYSLNVELRAEDYDSLAKSESFRNFIRRALEHHLPRKFIVTPA